MIESKPNSYEIIWEHVMTPKCQCERESRERYILFETAKHHILELEVCIDCVWASIMTRHTLLYSDDILQEAFFMKESAFVYFVGEQTGE